MKLCKMEERMWSMPWLTVTGGFVTRQIPKNVRFRDMGLSSGIFLNPSCRSYKNFISLTFEGFFSWFETNLRFSSSRCEEALQLFTPGTSQRCPILDMIEFLPETYKVFHWIHKIKNKKAFFKNLNLNCCITCHITTVFHSICWTAVWESLMMTTTALTTM